jgi:hypothetical protein
MAAYVILPNSESATISCAINYFQESASLPGKWILDDMGNRINLNYINNLIRFQLTIMKQDSEVLTKLPSLYESRLLEYFMLDISHNTLQFKGFDCYAFVSFLANASYCPASPPFDYLSSSPVSGDTIVISDGAQLPDAIKHWALCIGEDIYISKFGESGRDSQSLVELMDLREMMHLYSCSHSFVASLQGNSHPWSGLELA